MKHEEILSGPVRVIFIINGAQNRMKDIHDFYAKERVVAYPNRALSGEGPPVLMRPMGDWKGSFRVCDDEGNMQLGQCIKDHQAIDKMYVYFPVGGGLNGTSLYEKVSIQKTGENAFVFSAEGRMEILE